MIKLDNKLLKYLIIIVIIYFLVSKVSTDQLPGRNPFILTGIISVVIYILDQPNILFETFEQKQITQTPSIAVNPTAFKSMIIEALNEVKDPVPKLDDKVATTTITITDEKHDNKEHMTDGTNQKDNKKEVIEIKEENKTITDMLVSGLPTTAKIITDAIGATKADKCDCEETANNAIVKFLQNRRIIDNNGILHYADAYFGDMGYSQINVDKYIPLGANGNGMTNSWDLAQYNIINTDRWKPPTDPTPRCKSDIVPEPQPMDSRLPMNLMNFDYSRKVLPPENINTKYISDKLNQ